mgnify:CR=1 FL=1
MQPWTMERGITSLRLMTELAVGLGMTASACLAGTGVGERDLTDVEATVSPDQELRAIRNIVGGAGSRPALGIEAGLRYHFTAFGMLGFAMAACPTVGRALETGLRHLNLTFALTAVSVSQSEATTIVTLDDRGIPADLRAFVAERDAAAIVCLQRDLCPHIPVVVDMTFTRAVPRRVERYEQLLGLRPSFAAARTTVTLDDRALAQALPRADEAARRAAEEQCHILSERLRRRSRLSARIRDRLVREAADMPDMTRVAADLCLTPRTLRRRLDDEGTTFSSIRNEVRARLAEDLLATSSLSVEQIAHRLGYHEPTNFIAAFKKWCGTTPLAHRRRRDRGRGDRPSPPEGEASR